MSGQEICWRDGCERPVDPDHDPCCGPEHLRDWELVLDAQADASWW